MDTPAQKRAKANYRKKVRTVTLQFFPNNEMDAKIYAHIKAQPKMNQYVKNLVLRDMEQE